MPKWETCTLAHAKIKIRRGEDPSRRMDFFPAARSAGWTYFSVATLLIAVGYCRGINSKLEPKMPWLFQHCRIPQIIRCYGTGGEEPYKHKYGRVFPPVMCVSRTRDSILGVAGGQVANYPEEGWRSVFSPPQGLGVGLDS